MPGNEHDQPSLLRYVTTAVASLSQHLFMHPVEAATHRWQNSPERVGRTFAETRANFDRAVFSEDVRTLRARASSIYAGWWSAATHKAVVRAFKYGTQPFAAFYFNQWWGDAVKARLGDMHGKVLLDASAGAAIAALEPAFNPMDTYKMKRALRLAEPFSFAAMVRQERFNMYNGVNAAIARNVPGTFTLFYISGLMKNQLAKRHAQNGEGGLTLCDHLLSGAVGGASAAVVTNPAQVVKTRVNAGSGRVSTFSVFRNTVKTEGARALWKGTLMRSVGAVPKLGVPMAMAFWLPQKWNELQQQRQAVSQHKLPRKS